MSELNNGLLLIKGNKIENMQKNIQLEVFNRPVSKHDLKDFSDFARGIQYMEETRNNKK